MHVEPPPNPPVKSKNDEKLNKYCFKIKLCRDPKSQMSYLNEFIMALFDNGEPEEFLLFIRNFNVNLKVSGTIVSGVKIQ